MSGAIPAPAFPLAHGVQLAKDVAYLNMREVAAAAGLSKLWSDDFKTNAGIVAGESSAYTYRGASDFDVVRNGTAADASGDATMTAQTNHASYEPSRATDNISNSPYLSLQGNASGWLKADFGLGVTKTIVKYTLLRGSEAASIEARSPKNWTFEGSNNDADWTVLDTQANITDWSDPDEVKTYTFVNVTAYRYYRLNVTLNNGDAEFWVLGELQLMEAEIDQSVIQSVRALDLEENVTSVIPFVTFTEGTGSLDEVEVSTDDGATWTACNVETVSVVPAGAQLKLRVTFSGDSELESWGLAAA